MGDSETLDDLKKVLGLDSISGDTFGADVVDEGIDYIKKTTHAADGFYTQIENLRQPLKDLCSVNPASFDSEITRFRAARQMLGADGKGPENEGPDSNANEADTVSANVSEAQAIVGGDEDSPNTDPPWTGESGKAFNKWITHYESGGDATNNQWWMLAALEVLAEAHQSVYARVRDDVKTMLKSGKDAADHWDGEVNSPEGSVKFFVTVVAAVAAVGAAALAPPSATFTIGLVAAVAGQSASVLGAVPAEVPKADPYDINYNSPGSLERSMWDAYDKIQNDLKDRKKDVKDVLDALAEKLGGSTRKKCVGPLINDGKLPVTYENGKAVVDPEYVDEFDPPANA